MLDLPLLLLMFELGLVGQLDFLSCQDVELSGVSLRPVVSLVLGQVVPEFVFFALLGDVSKPEFHLTGPDNAMCVRTDGDHPAQPEGIPRHRS